MTVPMGLVTRAATAAAAVAPLVLHAAHPDLRVELTARLIEPHAELSPWWDAHAARVVGHVIDCTDVDTQTATLMVAAVMHATALNGEALSESRLLDLAKQAVRWDAGARHKPPANV